MTSVGPELFGSGPTSERQAMRNLVSIVPSVIAVMVTAWIFAVAGEIIELVGMVERGA